MRPWLLRPAFEIFFSTSERSGFERVISSKVETDIPRRPGDVGRYMRIGIAGVLPGLSLQVFDDLAIGECDDGLLPRTRLFREHALAGAQRVRLTRHAQGVHLDHLLARKHRLDRCLDLVLIRFQRHLEGVARHSLAIAMAALTLRVLHVHAFFGDQSVPDNLSDLHGLLLLAPAPAARRARLRAALGLRLGRLSLGGWLRYRRGRGCPRRRAGCDPSRATPLLAAPHHPWMAL